MSSLRFRIALSSALLMFSVLGVASVAFTHVEAASAGPRLIAVALLTIAGSGVLASFVADTVIRPLYQLRRAARALASGSYDGTLSLGGGREVRELASSFNEMAARLSDAMHSLQQARSRLEALLDASRDGIVALDAHGAVRYLNPAAAALYGSI